MKKRFIRTCQVWTVGWLAVIAMILPFSSVASDKMQPEEIVAKHLESIGTGEARASAHGRIAAGTVVATLRSPATARVSGQVVMASDGPKNMLGMGIQSGGQFQEKFAFDGGNVTFGFAAPGVRGYWAEFLYNHQSILKEGLVGGVLSDAWPLLNLSEKKQRLEYKGTKKIDGKMVHEIKYIPHGSSDLEISLFFDAETFQHVRSEYTRVINAGLGTGTIASGTGQASTRSQSSAVDASGSQRPTRYKMVEQFSDFKKEGALTLPHTYKAGLELETKNGTLIVDWEFTLTDFAFNQPIPLATFNVNPKQ